MAGFPALRALLTSGSSPTLVSLRSPGGEEIDAACRMGGVLVLITRAGTIARFPRAPLADPSTEEGPYEWLGGL